MVLSNLKNIFSQYKFVIAGILLFCSIAYGAKYFGDDVFMLQDLDVTSNIIVGGTVDGRDIATDGAVIDSITTNGVDNLTAAEVTQLSNIDTETIINSQWAFLGASDQGIATTDQPTFAGVIATDAFNMTEISTPGNPSSGSNKLYFKSDGNLYKLDDVGAEAQVGGSNGDAWSDPIDSNITLDTDSTYSIGTASVRHLNIHSDAVTAPTLTVGNGVITNSGSSGASGTALQLGMTAAEGEEIGIYTAAGTATSGHIVFESGDSSAGNTGNINLQTGDASSGNSGSINIKTGTASGTRAGIFLMDGTEGTDGECWTSTGIFGQGNWETCASSDDLFETKVLTADVTSNGTISDLTFTGMTIGRHYEVMLQMASTTTTSDDEVIINVVHDSVTIARAEDDNAGGATFQHTYSVMVKFEATATSVTFSASDATANSFIRGNSTQTETFVQLTELNNTDETTIF